MRHLGAPGRQRNGGAHDPAAAGPRPGAERAAERFDALAHADEPVRRRREPGRRGRAGRGVVGDLDGDAGRVVVDGDGHRAGARGVQDDVGQGLLHDPVDGGGYLGRPRGLARRRRQAELDGQAVTGEAADQVAELFGLRAERRPRRRCRGAGRPPGAWRRGRRCRPTRSRPGCRPGSPGAWRRPAGRPGPGRRCRRRGGRRRRGVPGPAPGARLAGRRRSPAGGGRRGAQPHPDTERAAPGQQAEEHRAARCTRGGRSTRPATITATPATAMSAAARAAATRTAAAPSTSSPSVAATPGWEGRWATSATTAAAAQTTRPATAAARTGPRPAKSASDADDRADGQLERPVAAPWRRRPRRCRRRGRRRERRPSPRFVTVPARPAMRCRHVHRSARLRSGRRRANRPKGRSSPAQTVLSADVSAGGRRRRCSV